MGTDGTWKDRFRQHLSGVSEPMPGMPLVEIAGQGRILIENHRGVCSYGREQIRVRVKYGQIEISGCGLVLGCMSRERIVVTGHIDAVRLIREV